MAVLRFADFGGIAPGMTPVMLPQNAAQIAHNCRLDSGRIEPIRHSTPDTRRVNYEGGLKSVGDAKTIYLWHRADGSSEWIAWPGRVSVAPSNLANETRSRLFVSGDTEYNDGEPVMLFANELGYSTYPMIKEALPKCVAKVRGVTTDENTLRYTFFFQTWVDEHGYESPVSEASDEVTYNDGQEVEIGEVLVTSEYAYAVKRRVYKVIVGTETEAIQFIAEQDRSDKRFPPLSITVKDENSGEIIQEIEAPPKRLDNLLWMPGGFYAGTDRDNPRTVCFSEVNLPYSWPNAYRYSVKDDIVGIAAIGNSLLVLTEGSPWIVSGTSPDAMSVASLSTPYPCVSRDSICTMGNVAYYASHAGICSVYEGSAGASLITLPWFTREAWQALSPESCRMVAHNGALYFWVDVPSASGETTVSKGFIINFGSTSSLKSASSYESGLASMVKAVTTHDEVAGCVFSDTERGTLCFVRREL